MLGGVVEEGPLAGLSIVPAEELPDRVEALDRACAALGDPAYGQARARGASLAYDELVHYLLDALDELIARGPPRSSSSARRREGADGSEGRADLDRPGGASGHGTSTRRGHTARPAPR